MQHNDTTRERQPSDVCHYNDYNEDMPWICLDILPPPAQRSSAVLDAVAAG